MQTIYGVCAREKNGEGQERGVSNEKLLNIVIKTAAICIAVFGILRPTIAAFGSQICTEDEVDCEQIALIAEYMLNISLGVFALAMAFWVMSDK